MKKLKLFFACLLMAVLSIGQVWATDYQLVTSTDDLEADAHYVIGNAASESGFFMATTSNSNNRKGTASITITNGKISATDAVLVLKLGGSTGAWTFQTTNYLGTAGYLAAASNNSNYCQVITDGTQARAQFTISFSGDAVVITATGGGNRRNMRYNPNNGSPIFACYANATDQSPIYLFKEVTGEETACATPTFSPAVGAVVSGTQVSISCSTEGAAIHYTTDGTNPTASSATYSAAIPVTSETTIKAIAVKAGLDNSSVASAAYTVLTPLTTMDQIFAAATTAGSTATPVAITFNNWVVTGVKNSNAYVTDGTKGFIIYTSSHGFQVGDILSGTAVCKVQLYNGSAELTELTASKVTVNTGGSVSPVVLDAEGIAALTGANTGSVIKISGECTYESSKYYIADVQLYNQLYSFSVSAGTNYECTGVYVLNTTYGNEILPRSAADIVAQTSVANPTFTPAAGEYTEVQNVTLSCATDGATVYYTTDGTNPTNESTAYSSAIEVGASMTIKAIAYKGEDHSEVVSAAYTINIPLPSHDFQVTHHFSTGEGFEFPTGWGGSYAEHEIAYTDDKVHFASASKQSGTITDRPVVKEGAVSLILTNSSKLISAVRFDYSQWSDKVPTFTMKYSTDGGETYNNFDPVVSSTDFALQVLDLPENVNAIQVVGTANKQTGLTSIAFDLEDKVVVTKTVTITTPTNGTLVVKNAGVAISSGDAIEVGTTLTIEATPASGYLLDAVSVIDEDEDPVSVSEYAFVVPSKNVTVSATFIENVKPDATLTLSEIGDTHDVTGHKQDDVINLPLTATSCSKTFVGWDADADCDHAPTYAPGAEYTLESTTQTLYAVYANPAAGSTWNVATSVTAGDVVVISTNTEYTAHDMKTVGAISGTVLGATASTYGSENATITELAEGTLQFIVGGNATDGWTLKNGTKYLKVTAAKKVGLVDDEETWTISFSGNNATLAPKTGDYTGYSIQYNYNTGNDRFTAYNTTQVAISLYKQVVNYENYSTDCQAAVATPTFSPAAGTYTEAQTVTISTETADATIYYTTNGDEPTASSTEYTAAISVSENMTIKAIAVKAGMANSAVATAEYTINLPLSTMDQIFAAATAAGSTATDANIAFNNWVVSGVSTNGKNVFVTDGTKGFIIFDNGGEMGFAVGDVLSGTVACKVQLYKGAAELTTLSSATEGLNIATGGSVTPEVKAISALSGINTGAPVTINSVQFDGEYLSDGANNIKPFNSLFAYDALENGKYYNVTGIYQQFDATKEILPRSAEDIEEVDLADPEISYTPASATIELGESLPGTTFANPHELAISYSSNNEAVATVSNAGVIALGSATGTAVITASFAGDATYAAANVTYTITVNPASVSENVVILAVYDTKYYAMSTTHITSSNAFTAIEIEYDGSQVTVASEADKAAIQWTKKTSGENHTFQTKDEDHKYMKGTTSGAAMSLDANVCNWSWDDTNEYFYIGSRSFFFQNGVGFKNFATSNLNKSGYSGKAQVIAIAAENIVITSKVSAELAYDPESDEITQGDAWSAPSLVNPHSVTITSYNSDNEAVATVTDGGVIALAGGIGTAVITAHFDGDASYLEGDAVYTITVNAPASTPSGTSYVKVTSTADITADGEYLLVNENALKAFNGNLETLDAEGNTVDVVISGGKIAGTSAIDAAIFTIDASNGNLRSHSGHYVGVGGYSNGLAQSDEAGTYANVFAINASENVDITITFTGGDMHLLYNTANRFRYYKAENQTNKAIQLYKKESSTPEPAYTTVRSGLDCGRHYTVCLENNVTAVKGATFWSLRYKNEASKVAYLELETVIEAGKPYIFQATADKLEVVYGEEVAGAPVANGALVGTFEDLDADDLNGISGTVYMLFNNELRPIGANNHLDAHRAYVLYDLLEEEPAQGFAPGKKVKRMPMQSQTTTDCELINAAEAPAKMMINGQLFILRGEKMYDTTGRLVK